MSPGDLDTVAGTRVFFGHQSVGQNVLDGIRDIYAADGRPPPPAVEDACIGENEQPLLKIDDFDTRMRAGTAGRVDVAMMKLCYVDVTTHTDVRALFGTYRTTLAGLERDFPTVAFLHITVPLTTEPGPLARFKARLAGRRPPGPGQNVHRERLNDLLRREYACRLVDLAAAESTRPDGTRVTGEHNGSEYHALFDGYASDDGHLNALGARVAATTWITAVARAAREAKA